MPIRSRLPALFALALALAVSASAQPPEAPTRPGTDEPPPSKKKDEKKKADPAKAPEGLADLKYRPIGPLNGGRASCVAGVPGDPLTYYVGSAAGGVWKSSDGGLKFEPVFDDSGTGSVGAIAVCPADPNVVYVGSGEGNIRGNVAPGNGIHVSTDAGKTWKHCWKQVGQIPAIAVHPKNPRVAFAAVLGHAFGPNPERGVYRTENGGATWTRVLHKDADTGGCDIAIDPVNPRVVWAALWQTRRKPWELTSGGPAGSGLYVSRDGGTTWDELSPAEDDALDGLPRGVWGRIGIGVAPSDPRRVYALIEAEEGGLFRTDDGGEKWQRVSGDHILRQRAWYFSGITVDPVDKDTVYFPQVSLIKSIDGGKTVRRIRGTHHMDHHHLWIDPKNPRRMIVAHDGGADITTSGGETWHSPALPIAQFYHISVDSNTPYNVMGTLQDMGTGRGPSHSLAAAGIRLGDWETVGGGECGHAVPLPHDPDTIFAGSYGGILTRFDRRTGQAALVSAWPFDPSGFGADALKYRFQWVAPLLASRHQPGTVYHAAQVVFRSDDLGQSWKPVSGDLTRNDKSKQRWSGGPISGDNTGVEVYNTVFALAEGAKRADGSFALWAGTDDGRVHVTRDGGKTWADVGTNVPGLPKWGTVACVEPSPRDPDTAYLVIDAHKLDDYKPYVWATRDLGKTWTPITKGLGEGDYGHVIREDPERPGLLYLGTERRVMVTWDAAAGWQPLQLDMPPVAVHDLVVHAGDLVVGTMGRGAYILDDLTPVRKWSPEVAKKPAHLFPPRPATRWRLAEELGHLTEDAVCPNPEYGAVIDYYLSDKSKKRFKLAIADAAGKVVREFTSDPAEEPDEEAPDGPPVDVPERKALPNAKGVQRFYWDLRATGAAAIPGAKLDAGNPTFGPYVPPGTYTARLTVDGVTESAPVEVRLDPRFLRSAAAAQPGATPANAPPPTDALGLELRDAVNDLSKLVSQVRSLQKQIDLHTDTLKGDPSPAAADWRRGADGFSKRLTDLEEKLHNPRAKVTYDILAQKGGAKLYSQLVYLYEFANSADGPVPQGLGTLAAEFMAELKGHRAAFDKMRSEVATFNDAARKADTPTLHVPK